MKKVLLPDTMPLDPVLPDGWRAVVVDARAPIPPAHADSEALVVWGASRAHLASAATELPRLRLVQSLSAGVDGILASGFGPEVVIAAGVGLHDVTVTEHTVALLLSLVRRIPDSLAAQARHQWSRELGGLQDLHPAGRLTTLLDARVVIWGFGHIGQTLAPVLTALGAAVTGVARSAGHRAGFPVIAARDLPALLPDTDVLVGILPATEATAAAIDASVFAALPRHALVVNVGRGATLDQRALADALVAGEIGGAAIDVTTPEPLPADSFLWDAPNLIITPHAAGGRPVGADARIARNVAALDSGGTIEHRAR
jgi:phosphoglycerate dehydrogenase-like enzyme